MIGKTISHYRILEKLGEGGMGVVYKAEDTRLERTVALKFLPRELTADPGAKERFAREARAASALDHPNICTIHDVDETEDGQMFMSLACYQGETVKEKIDRGPLSVEEALDVAIHVAEGLREAHSRGVVHRDIKPANIVVTPEGRVKIMDFGLAKLVGQPKLTRVGLSVGTVAYMSPEQARGQDVDHRTDIWSLGAVLYEMLTGRLPFGSGHAQSVIHSILNDEPRPVASLRPDVPAQLVSVVETALATLPGSRYCDAGAMLRDLRDVRGTSDPSAVTVEMPAHGSPPSIAVLPFANMSNDPEQGYFCDGMAEEIINALVQVEGVRVVARVSAFAFKDRCEDIRDIGRELNVENVLEGSVRKAGSQIRITAQLIKVADGYHLWSERYDRELEDIFAIQDEIARSIVEALEIKLDYREKGVLKTRPTESIDAYQAYLRGLDYAGRPDYSEEDFWLAVQMFERAIDLDPEFALAHAGLSMAYSALYFHGHDRTEASPTLAKAAVDRALKLQPALPDAHLALGYYHYWCRQDFALALAEFAIAERDLHDDARILAVVAAILKRQGKTDQAVEHYKRAFELSPQDASLPHEIGCALMTTRDYSHAERYYDRSIAMAPDQVLAYICAAWNHWLWKGDMAGARRTLEAIPDRATKGSHLSSAARFERFRLELLARNYQDALDILAPAPSAFVERQWWFIPKALLEAFTHRLMGNETRARDRYESALAMLRDEAKQRPSDERVHSSLGVALAGLGRKEEAIREGEFAVELMPVSKNAAVGPYRVEDLAFVYALVGEHDKAIDRLEYLLSIPFWSSVQMLHLDPRWDALREHPRFRGLLENLSDDRAAPTELRDRDR
ncbi:MAG: protein kinase [Candidatus Eisenbacteria bacterium]